MTALLTADEANLVRGGYMHMVDAGFGKIDTLEGVLKFIGAHAEHCRRERMIAIRENGCETDAVSKASRDAVIMLAELLELRIG